MRILCYAFICQLIWESSWLIDQLIWESSWLIDAYLYVLCFCMRILCYAFICQVIWVSSWLIDTWRQKRRHRWVSHGLDDIMHGAMYQWVTNSPYNCINESRTLPYNLTLDDIMHGAKTNTQINESQTLFIKQSQTLSHIAYLDIWTHTTKSKQLQGSRQKRIHKCPAILKSNSVCCSVCCSVLQQCQRGKRR